MSRSFYNGHKFDDSVSSRFVDALHRGDNVLLDQLIVSGPKHENVRAHCAGLVRQYLRQHGELPVPHLLDEHIQPDMLSGVGYE